MDLIGLKTLYRMKYMPGTVNLAYYTWLERIQATIGESITASFLAQYKFCFLNNYSYTHG